MSRVARFLGGERTCCKVNARGKMERDFEAPSSRHYILIMLLADCHVGQGRLVMPKSA